MGCVTSKQAVSITPAIVHSGALKENGIVGSGRKRDGYVVEIEKKEKKKRDENENVNVNELSELCRFSGGGGESLSFRLGNLNKYVEGEHVAAGWPAWLSAVAGEAIHGWIPLRADAFEKLEKEEIWLYGHCSMNCPELSTCHGYLAELKKIGQGTYSTVFRARELETGRIVAIKKVRFDNFEPESVRFMAREILILRRLDHPNVIKLDGLITSKLSCSIYLVFEYMEHDLMGLLSCPDIKFSEPQIKCYMKQLLSALDHCHTRGVMHRDIKGSNLLVNNEGILKVADFGLANFCNSNNRQPLTSRVVTLWYRPPELLLGSTDYGVSVDLWSIGCVFAELLIRKPILQGRTEVEQLHKIFKLCGSPPEDYWKKSKLPHATLFKPQQPYESCLWETFKGIPSPAVKLIETLLSVEPYRRGTASSALASEYFKTKPYACDPSSLPKYTPNKEIDAKNREDARRKRTHGRVRDIEIARKPARKLNGTSKLVPTEDLPTQRQGSHKITARLSKEELKLNRAARKPSFENLEDTCHGKNTSQGDIPFSGPFQVSASSGFAWARRRKDDVRTRSSSRSLVNDLDSSLATQARSSGNSMKHESGNALQTARTHCRGHDSYELARRAIQKQWGHFERPGSFDASDEYHSQELSLALYQQGEMLVKRNQLAYKDDGEKVEFSGPLLSQSHKVDELLERHERHIRQAVRRSWFQRGKKNS